MNLGSTDVLCIYGIGEGELYPQFQKWLKADGERFLLFIEDEEEAFHASFRLSLFEDPQVRRFFINPQTETEILKEIAWDFVFLRFSYLAHPAYLKKKPERVQELFARMAFFQSGVELSVADYSDLGEKILSNIRHNSRFLHRAYLGESLKDCFQGIPAIICGGGPSLFKNGSQLAQLSDRALIFGGGSTLNVLDHLGLFPHFGAAIDPKPPYERFLQQNGFEVPFFYQSRTSHRLLSLVHGPRLWVSDNGGYPFERWLASQLSLPSSPFDGGWNVGNFCTALSILLGCNPIIFVGMDLSTEGERLYGPGVEEKARKENLMLVHDQEGKPFYSRRDWVMAAEWTEALAQRHPKRLFINATEGGMGFKEMFHLTLAETTKLHLKRSFDLEGSLHAALEQAERVPASEEQISHCLMQFDESLKRSEAYIDRLLFLMEAAYPKSPHEKGEFVLNQFELEEELAAQQFLEPLWNIWKHVFQRRLPHGFSGDLEKELHKILFFKRVLAHAKI